MFRRDEALLDGHQPLLQGPPTLEAALDGREQLDSVQTRVKLRHRLGKRAQELFGHEIVQALPATGDFRGREPGNRRSISVDRQQTLVQLLVGFGGGVEARGPVPAAGGLLDDNLELAATAAVKGFLGGEGLGQSLLLALLATELASDERQNLSPSLFCDGANGFRGVRASTAARLLLLLLLLTTRS